MRIKYQKCYGPGGWRTVLGGRWVTSHPNTYAGKAWPLHDDYENEDVGFRSVWMMR